MYEKAKKYMQLARVNAELFSKDPHTQVGAILLAPDFSRILSTGINGFPRKLKDDLPERWERPGKYTWVAHAEANAVCNAARSGTSIDGAVAVVTLFPCSSCTKTLIQAGIQHVYVPKSEHHNERWAEDFETSRQMLEEVGIEISYID
jgi:dCMP deaminase